MVFSVSVDKRDLKRIRTALKKVESRVLFWSNQLPVEWSKRYMDQLKKNIDTQAFDFQWSRYPYNFKYYNWKKTITSAGFWELSGSLKKAISFKKVGGTAFTSTYFSGIPRGLIGSGLRYGRDNPREIYYYASMMEWGSIAGGQFHPPRPLFKPTHEQLRPAYEADFQEAVEDIKRQWS